MADRSILWAAAIVAALSGAPLTAQTAADENLRTCLSGRYPTLCNRSLLTASQRVLVERAEAAENLRTCLVGRYPTLCKHDRLTAEQAQAVRAAERAENLRTCVTGKYPALCKRDLLTAGEAEQVREAERAENLRTCLTGRYPALCRRDLLTPAERRQAAAAELAAPKAPLRSTRGNPSLARPRRAGCESGHWIDSVSDDGTIIKLEDGSIWEVDDVDAVTSMIWLPITDVLICGDKMINVDDNESVVVTRLK